MFGWEFPPFVSGGLGVASEGLVRGLLEIGAEVVLVLPHESDSRKVPPGPLRIVDGAESGEEAPRGAGLLARMRRISSPLRPYLTREIYRAERAARTEAARALSDAAGSEEQPDADGDAAAGTPSTGSKRAAIPDPYGPDLAAEVMRYARAARAIALRERFDVIHAHDWLTFLAGIEARRVSGRPLAAHVHATELDRSGGDGDPFVRDVERLGVTFADRVIAVSRYTARQVEESYGIPPDRIRVVHNAIDAGGRAAATPARRKQPVVLFAGRITGQKGPDRFVEAAALVAREIADVRFVVAGEGDRLEAMRDAVRRHGLSGKFEFVGFVPGRELARLYALADVYVMPSVSEPFGLTALEALQQDTPVIVSKHAGVGEVVRHVLRADVDDTNELASQILSVLLFPPLSRVLSAGGRAEVRRMSWAAAADKCVAVYREMLEAV